MNPISKTILSCVVIFILIITFTPLAVNIEGNRDYTLEKQHLKYNITEYNDTNPPRIEQVAYELYKKDGKWWYMDFEVLCNDDESGMNRVEFYLNDMLKEVAKGSGPWYSWDTSWNKYLISGIICKSEITDEYMEFYAITVKVRTINIYSSSRPLFVNIIAYDNANNSANEEVIHIPQDNNNYPSNFYSFQYFKLLNNYNGFFGKFLIFAIFKDAPADFL